MHGTDSFLTSKCETQRGKKKFAQSRCKILHELHKLRKKRARKTSPVVLADSKSRFTLSRAQSKTPTYILATLRDSNTILFTNSQTLYTEGLERVRRRQLNYVPTYFNPCSQMSFYKVLMKTKTHERELIKPSNF